jgi:hypothetical protein
VRLAILDSGHAFGKKALLAFVRTVSRMPVADIVKLVLYRPDFFGGPFSELVQETLRGPSQWSVADREMMGAYVSKVNDCEY